MKLADGDETWSCDQPSSAWPARQRARYHEETARRIAEQKPAPPEARASAESFQEPSRPWSLALFLLSLFAVWVQEKRRQS